MIPAGTDKMLILASFLQYVTSFCLHFTNDLTLSVTLSKLYLKSTKHAEIVLLQQIISWCARVTMKQNKGKMDGFELLNMCVCNVLQDNDLSKRLATFLNEFVHEYMGGRFFVFWR